MVITLTKEEVREVLLSYIETRVTSPGINWSSFTIIISEYDSDEFVKFTEVKNNKDKENN